MDVGNGAPVDGDLLDLRLAPGIGDGLALDPAAEVGGGEEVIAAGRRGPDQDHDETEHSGGYLGDTLPTHDEGTLWGSRAPYQKRRVPKKAIALVSRR